MIYFEKKTIESPGIAQRQVFIGRNKKNCFKNN